MRNPGTIFRVSLMSGLIVFTVAMFGVWWNMREARIAREQADLEPVEIAATEDNSASVNSTVLKPAEVGVTELAAVLTGDTARVNGVKCPVYRRENGTCFALVGGERIEVERVAGYERRNGNAVSGYYRTIADASGGNNFSADLHK